MKYKSILNFINGKLVASEGNFLDVTNPSTGDVIAQVPMSTIKETDLAVQSAKKSFPDWAGKTLKERAQIFFDYRTLLEKHKEELAQLIHEENGKLIDEARAEIDVAIEMVEFACSLPRLMVGEIERVSTDVECRMEYVPIGVVASLTPFNFPVMVLHWTIPNALVSGNTMILKPSEQVPLTPMRIAELLTDAGVPSGVFNIVHGAKEVVGRICDHPDIAGVTFVGSTPVAKIVYSRATASFKRALCLGGAKNLLIILPDADAMLTSSNVVSSSFGSAGQRCMASSVVAAVGQVNPLIEKIREEAKQVVPGETMGPVISRNALNRIEIFIEEAIKGGAKILLDGRTWKVQGKENGFFLGPTILDYVKPEMKIAHEEVFGPVLIIIRVDSIDEALDIQRQSKYGNASSIYTQSGEVVQYFTNRVSAGMLGVNIGVPVPREPFSFGGWNQSKFGAGDITGKSSIEFWNKRKKISVRW